MKRKVEEGQVWKYRTRSGEENSIATILKIDTSKNGLIISAKLDNLKIKTVNASETISTVDHVPISAESFKKSISELLTKNEIAVNEGYKEWHKAYLQNKAGVYTISLAEIVALIESTLNEM